MKWDILRSVQQAFYLNTMIMNIYLRRKTVSSVDRYRDLWKPVTQR